MQRRMLSKEDEAATGGEEVVVRREDQDRINKFSRLHQRELALEEEVKAKQKDKEDLEEVSNELELVDEDEKVPYKIGDCFVHLPQAEVMTLLSDSTERIEKDVSSAEEKLSKVRDEMQELKVALYARFGRKDMVRYPSRSVSAQERSNHAHIDYSGSGDSLEKSLISFQSGDPAHPHNWSSSRKSWILGITMLDVFNSTVGTSLPSGGSKYIARDFHVTSDALLVLPIAMYLVGYILGPLVFAPISESYGRKPILVLSFAVFTTFTMACALAPNFAAFVIFRLICGVFASCPLAVVGGICADIYQSPKSRGRAMAFFMGVTGFGPLLGPILSGYISTVSWRWTFWVALIIAGITLATLVIMPETYAAKLLQNQARERRKKGESNVYAPIELEHKDLRRTLEIILMRPMRMILFEPIVTFTCIYLSLIYGIFFMFFQAYPIIYEGTYGFSPGQQGLAFLSLGVGFTIAGILYFWYDSYLERAQARAAPWAFTEEGRRLPLACISGPFLVISMFWTGWTARPDIHWIVPILSGIFFGFGFMLIFMALLNYVVDAYEIFAASAMAATNCTRSVFGACLPFAATPLYARLGIPWACSLLGFLQVLMCVIPFVFYNYGPEIRARSKFCQYLLQKKREEQGVGEEDDGDIFPEEHSHREHGRKDLEA
ncbi:MFS general substrate transporter [Patellaria atrata CBS 101060]|uniref:MFS general substrate transporter n=1 Tax=Patellaria atrata CBS 101060 TaxID=1346257 RepID=A0A9P4SJ02_9PEZI|nr:MFS general substrate transporter [Patellaria atrata CBS 101060]